MMLQAPRLQCVAPTLWGLILAIGLVAWTGLGCRKQPRGPKATPLQITIACPRTIGPSLVIIGHQKGFLARGGDRTTLIPFDSGKASLAHMLAGGADLALVAETPVAEAILTDAQFKILATVRQSSRDVAIVARRDRGIQAPADLRGKVIGYTKGTSGHFYLDTYCLVNKVDLGDLRHVNLPPLELRSALLDGRVDAVSTWNPHVAFLTEKLGDGATVFQDETIYMEQFCLVARPEFIRDHPAQVQALLEGLFRAMDFVAQSPAEARDLVAAYTQVPPALVAQSLSRHDLRVRLDQALILGLESEGRWFLESGAVKRREFPEVLSYIYLPALLEVKPQAVQIIRVEEGDRP